MPSLRKRVSTYLRQLSFHNEPRQKRNNINDNVFVTKYLQGNVQITAGPPVIYGKTPTDLPNYELSSYECGFASIDGCYSGPNGGLTTVKRTEKHLSLPDTDDIDFIDTAEEAAQDVDDLQTNLDSINLDDAKLPKEWNNKSDCVFGISKSLYDINQATKNRNGDPIADCFGIIARKDSAILAVADGVNWGEKACLAAKSAIHGCLHYLNKTIFHDTKIFESLTVKSGESGTSSTNYNLSLPNTLVTNTRDVFISLLRAFNCAHDLILENNGMLTTLTVAVVLPLKKKLISGDAKEGHNFVCCVCNVGDTLAYVYSRKYGVREITKGSHDVNCNRDMRDALGALGPVDGINPELSNLTLSITTLQKGDIVMVASDGLTDNFDPNVCKFTVNSNESTKQQKNPETARTSQKAHRTSSNAQASHSVRSTTPKPPNPSETVQKHPVKPPRRSKMRQDQSPSTRSSTEKSIPDQQIVKKSEIAQNKVEYDNPLIAHFMSQNALDSSKNEEKQASLDSALVVTENKASSLRRQASKQRPESAKTSTSKVPPASTSSAQRHTRPNPATESKYLRSKTSIDLRSQHPKQIQRNEDGLPFVSPIQRYEIQLLLIEDILKNGISGKETPCSTARRLCENLVSFAMSITSAKRQTLEDPDLYFDNRNGVLVEVSQQEKKMRRKRALEKVQNLPGKLDHVSIVAYNVGFAVCEI